MRAVAGLVRLIYGVNSMVGAVLSYLALGIVIVCFTVVVLRYFFQTGAVWLQDLYIWMNGIMFMGLAGYALLKNVHVRVDIFYGPAGARWKAKVDMLGAVIFIFPFVYILFTYALPYVQRSWRILESSPNAGGLEGLYIVKSFILVFAVSVGLQGLAMLLRGLLVLMDQEELLPEGIRYSSEEGN